tara:strand:- start:478 stop:588 length:111 start_codon:yes stop_codon:yes gene_type:complete
MIAACVAMRYAFNQKAGDRDLFREWKIPFASKLGEI